MRSIFIALGQAGLLKRVHDQKNMCGFHFTTQHSIEDCVELKSFLQDLIDRHLVQCFRQNQEEEVFTQTREESTSPMPKPLVIHFTKPSSITTG